MITVVVRSIQRTSIHPLRDIHNLLFPVILNINIYAYFCRCKEKKKMLGGHYRPYVIYSLIQIRVRNTYCQMFAPIIYKLSKKKRSTSFDYKLYTQIACRSTQRHMFTHFTHNQDGAGLTADTWKNISWMKASKFNWLICNITPSDVNDLMMIAEMIWRQVVI